METKALIPLVGSKVCLEGGGVIRLLDQIKTQPFPNFICWQILATQHKSSNHNTIQASMQRVYEQWKVIHATGKKVNGRSLEGANIMLTRRFLAWFPQVVLSYMHVDGDYNPCYPAILTNTLVPQPNFSSILQNQLGVALDALTLLDQLKTLPFPNFNSWQILATQHNQNTIQAACKEYMSSGK